MSNIEYTYEQYNIRCTWFISDVTQTPVLSHILHALLVIIPILLPMLPVAISCILSIKFLVVTSRPAASLHGGGSQARKFVSYHKRRATNAIIAVTALFLLFNLPASATTIVMLVDPYKLSWDTDFYFNNFQEVYCVAVNACLNPIVYIITIKRMKKFVINIFTI